MKQSDKELLEKAVNPFTVHNFVEVREISTVNKMININDIQDGVIVRKNTEVRNTYCVEDSSYCKVFTRMGFRLHISELSDNAKSLFLWIIYEIDNSSDYIEFDTKRINRYRSECRKSNTDFNNSIKELIRASVISHTGIGKIYWTNPLFFFNGNRLKKYPDKTIER